MCAGTFHPQGCPMADMTCQHSFVPAFSCAFIPLILVVNLQHTEQEDTAFVAHVEQAGVP